MVVVESGALLEAQVAAVAVVAIVLEHGHLAAAQALDDPAHHRCLARARPAATPITMDLLSMSTPGGWRRKNESRHAGGAQPGPRCRDKDSSLRRPAAPADPVEAKEAGLHRFRAEKSDGAGPRAATGRTRLACHSRGGLWYLMSHVLHSHVPTRRKA